jgi:nuclear pore complex protein Nup62
MLRGKTLEEIINKWTADLEANVREFNRFSAEVAVWDRALIANGNNVSMELTIKLLTYLYDIEQIAALYSHVLAAEKQQTEINESLNHIEQQQRDLASTLDAYEKISQEIIGGQSSTLRTLDAGPADNERDKKSVIFWLSFFFTNEFYVSQLHARNGSPHSLGRFVWLSDSND